MSARDGVRLVCFDLGGVVVRLCRSWDEGCLAAGVEIRDRSRTPEQERRRREAVEAYQRGDLRSDDFFATVAETFNHAYTPAEVRRVHSAWILREYEGVGDLVRRIHAAGVRTACLSNTNEGHWPWLLEQPAIAALGSRHASHELRLAKPDERIYRAFEERENARAEEILFFEDTPDNAEAARAGGWRAEVVDPARETAPQMTAALREHGVLA